MDSKEWFESLSSEQRSVLEEGLGVAPPLGARDAIWGALATKLPATAAASVAAAHGVTVASLLKPLAVGLVLGAATATGITGVRLATSSAPAPVPAALATAPALPDAPAHPLPLASPAPPQPTALPTRAPSTEPTQPLPANTAGTANELVAPLAASAPVASFPSDAPAAVPENPILLESRRLATARASWRSGDARTALTELEALERDFPAGVLGQERDALRIQALAALGQRERARALAQRFLETHRGSPHAAAVERILH
jgi:hypothetical protein